MKSTLRVLGAGVAAATGALLVGTTPGAARVSPPPAGFLSVGDAATARSGASMSTSTGDETGDGPALQAELDAYGRRALSCRGTGVLSPRKERIPMSSRPIHLARTALFVLVALAVGLAVLAGSTSPGRAATSDSLYVGDIGDNTIKRFGVDAATPTAAGVFQGALVKSTAGLHGPMGLVFNADRSGLIVDDQNLATATRSDILLFSATTGALVQRIVPHSDPNAPPVARGVVLVNDRLFVANLSASTQSNKPVSPSTLLAYTTTGQFVADLTTGAPAALRALPSGVLDANGNPKPNEFHPRGVVVGPGGLLYVSNFPHPNEDPNHRIGGQVLRFDPAKLTFKDVFLTTAGGAGELNGPKAWSSVRTADCMSPARAPTRPRPNRPTRPSPTPTRS